MAMSEQKNFPPWMRQSKESMEQEIAFRTIYDEGEEFPKEEIEKTLKELNVVDPRPEYHYDNARYVD